MRQLIALFWFELRYQSRQPAFVVTALLLLGAGVIATASTNVQRARGITTLVNGPYAIVVTHLVLSIIAMFLVGHFVGRAATRDRTHRMDGLVLATPVAGNARRWGALLGAMAIASLAFLFVSVGTLLGPYWPDVSPALRGPLALTPYAWAYLVFVLPNLFFCAVLLFALAHTVRSMMGMYLGLVAFFVLYEVASTLLDDPSTRSLAALLDPFGLSAFAESTRYWSATEKNTLLVPFDGLLRLNRFIWLGVAVAVAVLFSRFHDERKETRPGRVKAKHGRRRLRALIQRRRRSPTLTLPLVLQQLLARTKLETLQLIGNPAFVILSLLTAFMLIAALVSGDGYYGTRSWPLTRMLSETIQGALSLLILIVVAYYTAESVWRERQTGVALLIDASPIRNALLYLPKLFALWAVIAGLLGVGVLIAVIYQTASGYTDYEWSVYAQTLSLQYLLPAMLVAVLSLLIQVLSPGKYIGMLVFAAYVVASLVLPQLGLEHHLWRYSEGPEAIYSDMNGLGHYLPALVSYHLYWTLLAVLLVLVGYQLWPRGAEYGLRARLRAVRSAATRRTVVTPVALLSAFAALGGFIFYNTNIVNTYTSADGAADWRADYERELQVFDAMRPPAIRAVTLTVDIDPLSRRMVVDGEYRLGNISDQPITEFMLSWAQGNSVTYTLAGSREQRRYAALNAVHVTLTEPLLPGETRTLAFTVERINRGFRESEVDNRVVRNGTFINNQELLPRLGFDADQNLTDPQQRTKRGLGVAHGFPALEDTTQYWRTYLGADVQRVELDITIATDLEQIAVAPGRLLREWRDGGRRYFRYQTEQPVLNFFTVLSGEYTVERERHNGIDIEVYHHPTHGMNVARMIEAVRHALDYFGAEFGPYQYRQLRIIEFPRYEQFAQSFANTIPYSEDIGFVADLRSPRTIDYVYSVTAHELAHQWWGHQIAPANVQGGTVLSESLAQYSAYMLIRERYGEAYLRRFLKWEHDRYLRGRSNEVDVEQVLMRTENKPYIHYQKGGLVMWALQDLYGTDRFHAALRSLLAEFRYRDDRHATTLDLLARLRSGANDEELAFLRDSFARITLYDFRIESANGRQRADGRYQVDVTLSGEKSDVAGDGSSTTIALNERIDVALLAEHPDAPLTADGVVSVESQRLTSGQQVLRLISERRPTYIAVDPFLKRIDRTLDDNTMAITWASGVADKRD